MTHTNTAAIQQTISERVRRVSFTGESPTEEWIGSIEVMGIRDGNVSIHVERSHKATYGGKKWHRTSTYLTIDAAAWAHLISTPTEEV